MRNFKIIANVDSEGYCLLEQIFCKFLDDELLPYSIPSKTFLKMTNTSRNTFWLVGNLDVKKMRDLHTQAFKY